MTLEAGPHGQDSFLFIHAKRTEVAARGEDLSLWRFQKRNPGIFGQSVIGVLRIFRGKDPFSFVLGNIELKVSFAIAKCGRIGVAGNTGARSFANGVW